MKIVWLAMLMLSIASCGSASNSPTTSEAKPIGMPNPASVKCIQDGHKLEIRTSENGGQYGVCINAQGKECEEWAYFRGECRL